MQFREVKRSKSSRSTQSICFFCFLHRIRKRPPSANRALLTRRIHRKHTPTAWLSTHEIECICCLLDVRNDAPCFTNIGTPLVCGTALVTVDLDGIGDGFCYRRPL